MLYYLLYFWYLLYLFSSSFKNKKDFVLEKRLVLSTDEFGNILL
jgi:hypothetical protein